ncbi:MAG: hypothetical protein RL660_2350 [Bacteroidota bacterium]
MNNNFILAFAVLLLFLLLLVAIFLLVYIKYSKKFHDQFAIAQIESRDQERKRISADLHDDLGPILAATKLFTQSINATTDEDKAKLKKTNQHLDSCIERVRAISQQLMPTSLERGELVYAINTYIASIAPNSTLSIIFKHKSAKIPLSAQQQEHIYRIVTEIITNTLRHAAATTLAIDICVENGIFELTTKDNGKGMNLLENKLNGVGLANIRRRSEALKGSWKIYSSPNKGLQTSLKIKIAND